MRVWATLRAKSQGDKGPEVTHQLLRDRPSDGAA